MEQEPSDFLQDALLPIMKGLIAEALFKHCNEDVRVTVASCLSEILRIASPVQPYNDDQMKEIFQLIAEAFSKLSEPSTRCYEKALSILETIARVKACLLMLDLECEAQILHMCQHFWVFTRSNPSADESWAVEQIMADILAESEDISPDLLNHLLASVLKENEKAAPSGWKLGEKLILDFAAKLRPSGSPEHGIADLPHSKSSVLPRKREPKANSLMRPEEGYNLSWLYREGQTTKETHKRRISLSRSDLSAMPMASTMKRRTILRSNMKRGEAALLPNDLRDERMKLPTKGGNDASKGTSKESSVIADGLIGRRVKVWWPLDEMFYDGRIQSYDPIMKKHKVLYDDGDQEILNLEKECWEIIEDDLPDEHRQVAVNPKPITSPVLLRNSNGNEKSLLSTEKLNSKDDVKRAGATTEATTGLLEVEDAPSLGNQYVGGDVSSDDESTKDNVFEFRARSKDVQLENSSMSTSNDSTPEASLRRAIRVGSKDLQLDDESTEDNVFEFRARSKDVQLENASMSTSDDSTPEASPPRPLRVGIKNLQLENPSTGTSSDSTPEASPLKYIGAKSKDVQLKNTSNGSTPEAGPPRCIRAKSKDVQLQSTSDDSTPEGSPPRPWGLWRSRRP
ncbi:uncharacterized protein LOC104423223 [Eucalyptus grandis]|uniref:uncharacterized protein LOC104423223 n=1 Tax=Eucalyptus grandis TaxID=71139 RepID=UPI00192EDAD2|nr:uncharacterized protein LOC104423223 [Eucalyptus grandis]